jgi:predicted DNA-binding transcriptional regulator AlpA
MQERLIKASGLREQGVPYGRTRVMQLVAAGKFPQPIKLSPRLNVWKSSELRAWIESVTAQKNVA